MKKVKSRNSSLIECGSESTLEKTAAFLHGRIEAAQPKSIAELCELLAAHVEQFEVRRIRSFGTAQGVRVILRGGGKQATLPGKGKGKVYAVHFWG